MANLKRNYPLYETTVFRDFRVMTENVANKYPKRIAFSYKNDPKDTSTVDVTFEECRKDIRSIGTGWIADGLREKHVGIVGECSYGWITTYFALMSIGAVTVPIDKELPASEYADIFQKAEVEAIVYGSAIESKIEAIRDQLPNVKHYYCFAEPKLDHVESWDSVRKRGAELMADGDQSYDSYDLNPDKLATIVYTSGTTGKGKGVMLSQTNIVSDMTQGMYNFLITNKTMALLPPHHTFGSTVNFVGHYAQGATVYLSNGLKYLLTELKEQKPTHLILVPLFVETFYKRIWATAEKTGKAETLRKIIKLSNTLRKGKIDLRKTFFKSILDIFGGKLQMIICGGAALNQDIIDTFDAIGITILNGYGITECSPLISCNRNKYQKPGSVGTPIIGEQVKIAHPDENGEGEICIKGTNVMMGYYKDPEATKAAFDEEGYFKTGDYGKLDSEGWIYITGRLKNLIIFSNGKNVYPEEIENELSRIYGVNEVVVYAGESKLQKDKEVIVAEIYPDYDALKLRNIENIPAYFAEKVKEANKNMVSYKAVGKVKIRNTEFPKNTSKKIIRFAIDKTID